MENLHEKLEQLITQAFEVVIESKSGVVNYVRRNTNGTVDVYYKDEGDEKVMEFENVSHFFSKVAELSEAANDYFNYKDSRGTNE